jgi:DNA-binding MarR family transcriptional regulator
MKTTFQRLSYKENDNFNMAQRYYALLSSLNDLKLTERELQLVAFTAIHGNISYDVNRKEFCSLFNTSPPTINNMISRLKKLNMFIKDSGKIKVNPLILIPFDNDIKMEINIVHTKEA